MAELSKQLDAKIRDEGWDKKKAAKELGVCLASLYNYLNQDDLPGHDLFRRTHERWGFQYKYLNFGKNVAPITHSPVEAARQYILPFLETVRENDIAVVRTKSVRSDTLQVTINIKFAG